MTTLSLSSPSFKNLEFIPDEYSCNGINISPELNWKEAPKNTKSFALTMVDPDAPGREFVHWILYNIPPEVHHLPSNISKKPLLENGMIQGMNDFDSIGYGGPCPPPLQTHSYIFTIFALDSMLSLRQEASYAELQEALKNHLLTKAQILGFFAK